MEPHMNVIVVMSDSFRRDHIGAFGNPWIKTPALDRFAAQSVVFPEFR
ncbi:sulfatase-like hydrolase/transferase, partial [bacterium]|nr:sulfatase-like hydrolase/transferase [bacterium]